MERDTVIVLPSGTEIDVLSAAGDLKRIEEMLLERGSDDLGSDVFHVRELLDALAARVPDAETMEAMRRIVAYDLPVERADHDQQAESGEPTEGHIYHDLSLVSSWLNERLGNQSRPVPALPEGVKVTVDVSEQDGVPVVFVDTDEDVIPHDSASNGPRLRIRLNDHLIHGAMPIDDARLLRKFGPDTGN